MAILDFPETPVWAIASGLSGALLGHWLGRLHERGSKKEAARDLLITTLVTWRFKIESSDDICGLKKQSFPEIESAVFGLIPHLPAKQRTNLEGALRAYRELNESALFHFEVVNFELTINPETFRRARDLIGAALDDIKAKSE